MTTIAQRVERIRKEVSGVESQYGITSWERNFLLSIEERGSLSAKQENTLRSIEAKAFGEEGDDDE